MKRYLKFTTELDEAEEVQAMESIETQYMSLSNQAKTEDWVGQILDLFHEAVETHPKDFVQNVFFEFHHTTSKTREHQERIYQQMAAIGNFTGRDLQVQLVNVYRSTVSEVFDPYVSVVVACLQFKEGSFESFILANLGQGERNKVEFSTSRLRGTNIFDGYNPIVRNASSHVGSDGIIYEKDAVVFRNIGRNNPPKVDIVKWTNAELINNILLLTDFVRAIDIAVNIFGIDISWAIRWDEELHISFLSEILKKEQRFKLQKNFDELVVKIMNSSVSAKEKTDAFSNLFFFELRKRDLPCKCVRLNKANKTVLIVVPEIVSDLNNDDNLIGHILDLLRYGIIAEPCFRHVVDNFYIGHFNDEGKNSLKISVKKEDLRLYGIEEAGLYDLIVDSEVFLNGQKVEIIVDFNKLKEFEYSNLERNFPRKDRG